MILFFQDDVKTALKNLRDIAVFAFVMLNALFVLIVFLLQLKKSHLHIRWPFGAENTITFDESNFEIHIRREYLELEPIGLLFVLFFGIILIIQFIAMLLHRFATISQILASTDLDWYCSKTPKEMSGEAELHQNSVEIARILQRPKPPQEIDSNEEEEATIGRRNTIRRILDQHANANKHDWSNLEDNFRKGLTEVKNVKFTGRLTVSRKSMNLLGTRRTSMLKEQSARKSQSDNSEPTIQGRPPLPKVSSHQANDTWETRKKESPPPQYDDKHHNKGYKRELVSHRNQAYTPDDFAEDIDDNDVNPFDMDDQQDDDINAYNRQSSERQSIRPSKSVKFA